MRVLAALMMAALCWIGLTATSSAQETLNGRYVGVDDATGAAIQIAPDSEGFRGVFYDPRGNSQSFEADRVDDSAEAVLDMDGRTVLLRIAPLPFGAQVALIPFDQDGNLIIAASRSLGFVREGTRLPERPKDFTAAPRNAGSRIAGNAFISSYPFWEPVGVVNGYLSLPDRFLTLMRMFPAVQLDVIWKLCLAPGADGALALALRGQGVQCTEVRDGIAQAQRSGLFDRYKAEVDGERASLRMSMRCADGYLESKQDCDAAARRLSEHAISLRTARMVLDSYR